MCVSKLHIPGLLIGNYSPIVEGLIPRRVGRKKLWGERVGLRLPAGMRSRAEAALKEKKISAPLFAQLSSAS